MFHDPQRDAAIRRLVQTDSVFLRAYMAMGDTGLTPTTDGMGVIVSFEWDADEVRTRLGIADDLRWFTLCIELEARHWLLWCSFSGCWPGDGEVSADDPVEGWGEAYITAPGIMWLLGHRHAGSA